MGSSHVCPTVDETGPPIVPIVGNITFHHLMMIVGGACALWAMALAFFIIFRHATHYSNPIEQKQILRIATIIPSFAIISWICVAIDGDASPYIKGALDVVESIPLASFFLLELAYVCPDPNERDAFFHQLEKHNRRGKVVGPSSWMWYKGRCVAVIQWTITSWVLWIATVVTMAHGTYCVTSNSPHFAHLWITIFRIICTFSAIVAILQFYRRMKHVLKPIGALKQLFCFKFIVFLNLIQTTVISFLSSDGTLKANKYATFDDFTNGLPCFLLCLELAIIAPLMVWAYSPKRYIIGSGAGAAQGYYSGGPLGIRAILDSLNLYDMFKTFVDGLKAHVGQSKPVEAPYTAYDNGYNYAAPAYNMQSHKP